VKLTTRLHPLPSLRMCGTILPLPQYIIFMTWCFIKQKVRLHGVVFSQAQWQFHINLTFTLLIVHLCRLSWTKVVVDWLTTRRGPCARRPINLIEIFRGISQYLQ